MGGLVVWVCSSLRCVLVCVLCRLLGVFVCWCFVVCLVVIVACFRFWYCWLGWVLVNSVVVMLAVLTLGCGLLCLVARFV